MVSLPCRVGGRTSLYTNEQGSSAAQHETRPLVFNTKVDFSVRILVSNL